MLGRCRRKVLLCDEGKPRNRHSHALHGYLTRDGIDPAELNAIGRRELEKYGVACRAVHVAAADRSGEGFKVTFADGEVNHSKYLLIATGVVDDLPEVGGLRECYGRSVFHCPYCDGWERRDQRIAALGRGKSGVLLALSLRTWSPHIVLLTNGSRVPKNDLARLARNGIDVVTRRIARFVHDDGQLSTVEFDSREALGVDAVFFTATQHSRCDIAEILGCAFNRKGTVDTGTLSQTNVPGVFVAGDASRDAQFVVVAAAEGVKAALAINQALQREELRP